MSVVNSKYTYLMSILDVRAMVHTQNARVYLTDHRFPNLRRGSMFTNRTTNLLKANWYMKQRANSAIKNVLSVIHSITFFSTLKHTNRMVSMTVKPLHLEAPTWYRHTPYFLGYGKIYSLDKGLRSIIKSVGGLDLASSIETTQEGMRALIHSHHLIMTGTITDISLLQDTLDAYTAQYGYEVKVQPFNNHGHSTDYAVAHFIQYMDKQYKLPIAYNKYGQSDSARKAFLRWSALTDEQRHIFIEAILDSTRGLRMHRHISYRLFAKKQIKAVLALLVARHSEMAHGLRVARQAQAVADDKAIYHLHDRWSNHSHSKHIKSTQQWTLARGKKIDYSQTKDTEQLDLFNTEPHTHIQPIIALSAVLYDLPIDTHDTYKKANYQLLTEAQYIQTETKDRLTHSGTPP